MGMTLPETGVFPASSERNAIIGFVRKLYDKDPDHKTCLDRYDEEYENGLKRCSNEEEKALFQESMRGRRPLTERRIIYPEEHKKYPMLDEALLDTLPDECKAAMRSVFDSLWTCSRLYTEQIMTDEIELLIEKRLFPELFPTTEMIFSPRETPKTLSGEERQSRLSQLPESLLPRIKEYWEHHKNGRTKGLALLNTLGEMRTNSPAATHAFMLLETTLFGCYPLSAASRTRNPFWTPLDNVSDIEDLCGAVLGVEVSPGRDVFSMEIDDIFLEKINELLLQGKTGEQPHP
jgi:hypothetical protein